MKGSIVKEVLSDFALHGGTEADLKDFEFIRICDKSSLSSESIYFCNSSTFWNALLECGEKDVLVILAKKFYEEKKDELEENLSQFKFWGLVENIPLSMSFLSKPFFNEVIEKENDEVDGRQLGTCEIHPTAIISQNVFLGANVVVGKNARIYPGCVISSNSEVGEGTVLYPNVTFMPRTKVGKNCRIHSGTVIGSDGFGYNFADGVHHKVWHMGGVIIEDEVEVGSNCCIDQGTFSPTLIGAGSKIDNQVQVAHNVNLGKGVVLCGQAGLAGSASVGDFSVFGGGARIAPDTSVGVGSQVGGNAGVTTSFGDGAVVAGFPARPIKEWLKGLAYVRKMSLKK